MEKQLDYYLKNNIHAVEYRDDKSSIENHELSRINLLENHLGIPLSLFRDRTVLEFGPCSGENALLLAKNGAVITLVEPNIHMHKVIINNFKIAKDDGYQIKYPTILSDDIDSFNSKGVDYDIVIAEGFMHSLQNRHLLLEKLFKLSKSIVITSHSCLYGGFLEALKRFVFKRALSILNIDTNYDLNGALKVADQFFAEDYKKLNTTRKFKSWVLDILLNPCQTSITLDSLNTFVDLSNKCGYKIYGASPKWNSSSIKKWYKEPVRNSLLSEWENSLGFFISGDENIDLTKDDIINISKLTPIMLDYSSNLINYPDELYLNCENFSGAIKNISKIFYECNSGNFEEILKIYKQTTFFRNWGMPNQYLAFSKITNKSFI